MASDDGEYTDQLPLSPTPRYDCDADLGPNPFRKLGYLDRQFSQSSMVMLILFPIVAGVVALAFALAGVVVCQDPRARRNAWIVLVISLAPAAAFIALVAFSSR